MTRSVTTFDAEFTDEDFEAALAWERDRQSRCPDCGFPIGEATDPANVDAYDSKPVVCHPCATRAKARKGFESQENADTAGVKYPVREVG